MPSSERILSLFFAVCLAAPAVHSQGGDWLSWRGPNQNGTPNEVGLPATVALEGDLVWTYDLRGRGTPVVRQGRVYGLGYEGTGPALEEVLFCLDAKTGAKIWESRDKDFLSDVIYSRYSIGSPTIDAETGNVYKLATSGVLRCRTADGELVWEHALGSEYGRLTFPNGRTGAPLVVDDLCVVHVISSAWGPLGPARDRFYAFDKKTGACAWHCTPGGPPKDSSFSMPVVSRENGRVLLYAGLGGGHLVCVDARTGDPVFAYPMSIGGVNSSALLYGDSIIAIHGKENRDDSTIGRMLRLKREVPEPGAPQVMLTKDAELWRNDLVAFTSSPVLAGDRVYLTDWTGELQCVDAKSGAKLWHEKLAPDQIHASPAWGDSKLYVPMNNGSFYIVDVASEKPNILQKLQLAGNCLGAPALAGGRVYVHTTEKLYSFGGGTGEDPTRTAALVRTAAGKPARLQVLPADVTLQAGASQRYEVRVLDAKGRVAGLAEGVQFAGLPAKGYALKDGVLTIAKDAPPCTATLRVTAGGLQGSARLRVVPAIPFADDFESAALKPHPKEEGVQFDWPRPYWLSARLKWEVRELDGGKVLARTIDMPLFQRTMSMIGHPDMRNYTAQVDIRTDGNRRMMSSAGLVNQRYLIALKGNHQELEISSNMELLKESVPFRWKANTWYRLKTRVDVDPRGTATVQAKVWKRDDAEPEEWTLQVRHPKGHTHGSPGLYGFTPQSRFRVYLDNLSVTPND